MSIVTVKIPDGVRKKIEELALSGGFSVEQFVASAASEKLSVMLEDEFLRKDIGKGSDAGFKRFLASVPDVDPIHPDDVIK
ncbi:MAG: toxin-antitoxin system HicB family antitoxin [Pyrinomonadaceae bacterium]